MRTFSFLPAWTMAAVLLPAGPLAPAAKDNGGTAGPRVVPQRASDIGVSVGGHYVTYKGMDKRDWLGHASRLFNEQIAGLDAMSPHNELVDSGAYCLADPGRQYVVYSKIGGPAAFSLNLGAGAGRTFDCRFYNPRTGKFGTTLRRNGGGAESFTKPDREDWALHVAVATSEQARSRP